MSSLSELADPRKPQQEKTMFSRTYKLLRDYGALGDLTLGMSLGQESNSMNLFPTRAGMSAQKVMPTNLSSMSLFPQHVSSGASVSKEDGPKMGNCSSLNKSAMMESKKAQMTIFYAGQVIVFNDFPAEKAKEVLRLASMEGSKIPSTFPYGSFMNPAALGSSLNPPGSNIVTNSGINLSQEHVSQPSRPIVFDLPISRKASLTRFLEKRKDRIKARTPYSMSNATSSESKPWLGLASQSSSNVA